MQNDVILKVTSTAICGSDLHIYLNAMPGQKAALTLLLWLFACLKALGLLFTCVLL